MERKDRAMMLGNEEISKVLTKLAIPGIIAMLISAVYNIVDSVFVGMLNDTSAMGAVAVAFPLFMLIAAFGQMFGVGAGSYISRLLGEKNNEQADKVASTTFFTAIIVSLAFTIVGMISLDGLLKLFGATDTILPFARGYSRILLMGSIFTILNMTMNNMIRAEGSPKYSMYAISIGAILNIILDPILMFKFNLGLNGAALATVLAQGISTIFLLRFYLKGKNIVNISLKKFSPNRVIYSEVMKIGVATLARQALASLAMGFINSSASPYGDAAVAAVGISTRIISMVIYVVFGYCQGFQPVAGYNYGAKKFDRVIKAKKVSLKVTSIFAIVASVILFAFSEGFVQAFSSDAEVIRIGSMMIRGICILLPFVGFQNVYAVLFQSIGKGKEALFLSVARQGLFLIPAAIVLPRILGLLGVVAIQPFADFATIVVTAVLAVKLNKELHDEMEVELNSSEVSI